MDRRQKDILCKYKKAVDDGFLATLLMETFGDHEFKEKIHKIADLELTSLVYNRKSIIELDYTLIISLIIIAMDDYDGNFWPHVRNKYTVTYDTDFSIQLIENKIREIIKYVYGDTEDNTRIINRILEQALVPQKYLPDFFDFLFAILEYNYDYFLFEDDSYSVEEEKERKNELIDVLTFLFSDSADDKEVYRLYLDNSYRDYKLIKSTRNVLGNKDIVNLIIPFIMESLKLIEKTYFNEEINEDILNDYVKFGLTEWKKEIEKATYRKKTRERKKTERSILKPKIVKLDPYTSSIGIRTRRHNIPNYQTGDKFYINIRNNNQNIYETSDLVIKKVIGGARIEPISIFVDEYFENLEYQLYKNEEMIYSSLESLYIDYLIFDSEGNPLNIKQKYIGNIHVITTRELFNSNFERKIINKGYHYKGYQDERTYLDFGFLSISVGGIKYTDIVGTRTELTRAYKQKEEIKIFNKINSLIANITDCTEENLYLDINGQAYRFTQETTKNIEHENNKYLEIFMDNSKFKSGYYIIEIKQGKHVVEKYEFILDKELDIQEKISEENEFIQVYTSSFFETQIISQNISMLKKERIKYIEKEVEISNTLVKFRKEIELDHYVLNGDSYFINKYIWLDDVENKITLNISGIKEISFLDLSKKVHITNRVFDDKNIDIYKYEMSEIINRSDEAGMYIKATDNKNKEINIKVLKRNIITNKYNNIVYDNDEYKLDLNFVGKNDVSINVYDENKNIFTRTTGESENISLPLTTDIRYKIVIAQGEDNPFSSNQYRELKVINYMHYSTAMVLDHTYIIDFAFKHDDKGIVKIKNSFLGKLRTKEGNIFGDLYFTHMSGTTFMSSINPVKVEFLDHIYEIDGQETTVFAYIVDRDEDGIMFNESNGQIDAYGSRTDLPDADKFQLKIIKEEENV